MSWFTTDIVDTGRLPLFLCFTAFVATFVITRIITRTIRSGRGPFKDNVSASGLHVHHAVPGVVLLIVGAFLAIGAGGQTGWAELAGIGVGVGTSLVLDEFALILRLDDVYWSEEGRVSVEMVSLAMACLGLALLGLNPFEFDGSARGAAIVVPLATIVLHLAVVLIVVYKGKYRVALFATFIPMLGTISALRLARPTSRWAHTRYDATKLERARDRAARFDARYSHRFRLLGDVVAGTPQGGQAPP